MLSIGLLDTLKVTVELKSLKVGAHNNVNHAGYSVCAV
jgi:hypothetical protein